jgi:hypothetical protein
MFLRGPHCTANFNSAPTSLLIIRALMRCTPARTAPDSRRYATSTLGPRRLDLPIGKRPLFTYEGITVSDSGPTNYRQSCRCHSDKLPDCVPELTRTPNSTRRQLVEGLFLVIYNRAREASLYPYTSIEILLGITALLSSVKY